MPLLHEQHFRAIENLLYEWARAIDENRVEDICELLAPDGRYRVQSRFNADRGLPHSLMDAQSPAQLRDRIRSMRLAQMNLAGSAGLVSVEDAAVCEMIKRALGDGQEGESYIHMGGSTLESGGSSKLSERAIRNFWNAYREDMGI